MIKSLLNFFSPPSKSMGKFKRQVQAIRDAEASLKSLTDEELKQKTHEFKDRLKQGKSLDSLLPEAFAVVCEASVRTLHMHPFDVQLIGGMVLHQGQIAEMKTGEGKTLAATMPAYLNALAGKGVHIVTVNDYLAKRDSIWMGQIYEFLGLHVGNIVANLTDEERKIAYDADITYGTNNEIGFDYLRDNLKFSQETMVQRGFYYAIVDEVDSILIDEARTPLIISGAAEDSSKAYIQVDKIVRNLKPDDYTIDEKQKTVTLTESGNIHVEELLKRSNILTAQQSLYDLTNVHLVHHIDVALRAHKLFTSEKDYIIRGNDVVIIDEFTGRMMDGRRYSDGLHQALEAKEGRKIQLENQTLASITFQNLFRMYKKLSGMTGTALTEATEFEEIYKLPVVSIPANVSVIRKDENDSIYKTTKEKEKAILRLIQESHQKGQPILLGTISIDQSERFAKLLKANKIPFNVLNARHHEQEATIIAQAGKLKAITIATNMAGRGTDIQLGGNLSLILENIQKKTKNPAEQKDLEKTITDKHKEEKQAVLDAGGLLVIGSERHESRRIDNQLRGRSGRQGDPGKSLFFISLDDDLMRVFGSNRTKKMLTKLGFKEDEKIEHSMITKAIERAQKRVENYHFETRKQLIKYDDVINDQRKIVFQYRMDLIQNHNILEILQKMQFEAVEDLIDSATDTRKPMEDWDLESLQTNVIRLIDPTWTIKELTDNPVHPEKLEIQFKDMVKSRTKEKEDLVGEEIFKDIIKSIVLQILDQNWKAQLLRIDHLRESIVLRAYAQQDPLIEFKKEAYNVFENMMGAISDQVTQYVNWLIIEPAQDTESINDLPLLQPDSPTSDNPALNVLNRTH